MLAAANIVFRLSAQSDSLRSEGGGSPEGMDAQAQQIDNKPPAAKVNLEKARLEVGTVRVQLTLGLILIFVACLASYWSSLRVGFLLDDFLHVDYVARAFSGSWGDFLQNFTGNWAGSDIMRSYRPLASLSVFLDYLLYRTHAFGYHFTNVVLLFTCCLFVSLITLEITGLRGNRLGAAPAVWAGLLFAVYPLHPESVSWVIGRVDLLCTAFYLASLFCYLRFRLLKEPIYLIASLVSFLLSLLSKEMAVTLPAVICLMELFLGATQPAANAKSELRKRALWVLSFWLVLGVYTAFRTALLGTVVGGYSGGSLTLKSLWRTFADRATLYKLLFPFNEEVALPPWVTPLLTGGYWGTLLLVLYRLLMRKCPARPLFFLFLSAPLMVLPTFQIWHIFPNLCGSRLFFLGSAPLCILLALSALPSGDDLSKRRSGIASAAGTAFLLCIFAGWSAALQLNETPWLKAGQLMGSLRQQVISLAGSLAPEQKIVLLNLPQDYSGAGMLTRPQYLSILEGKSFETQDLSEHLLTIEPPISGSHDYLWPLEFQQLVRRPDISAVYIWNKDSGKFDRLAPASGSASYNFSYAAQGLTGLTFDPPSAGSSAKQSSTQPHVEKHEGFLRIFPGSTGVTIYFPDVDVVPMLATVARADLDLATGDGCTSCLGGRARLVWGSGTSQAVLSPISTGRLSWVGRYRSWTLSSNIKRLGLRLEPGDYHADFKELALGPQTSLVPAVEVLHAQTAATAFPAFLASNQLRLKYTAPKDTSYVTAIFTANNTTFDANAETEIATAAPESAGLKAASRVDIKGSEGEFALPAGLLAEPGVHQVRVVAYDRYGLPLGLPSEPVTLVGSSH